MNYNQLELTDWVIFLKPFLKQDAPAHLAGEDKEQQKWISGGRSNLSSVENWIEKHLKYWENNGPIFNFAIWVDGNIVGMVEANLNTNLGEGLKEGQVNISYGIYPDFRGKSYAPRAVDLILEFLHGLKIKQAVIRVNENNINGLKIPLKCGFKNSGEIKIKNGEKLRIFIKNL